MLLQPGQQFTIVRQLGIPGDSSTYYVRGVVKNSSTGATLFTVNLTDKGSQRFAGVFQVPADPSGNGLYIDITTSVYTDSGYTTYSDLYSLENANYIVRDTSRWGVGGGNSAGLGGGMVDYKKIQKMIDDAVATIIIPEMPEMKETDLSSILTSLVSLEKKLVSAFGDNLMPVNGQISTVADSLHKKIDELSNIVKSRPEFKETDIKPILAHLSDFRNFVSGHVASHYGSINQSISQFRDDILNKIDDHTEDAEEIEKLIETLGEKAKKMKRSNKFSKSDKLITTPDDYLEVIDSIYKKEND